MSDKLIYPENLEIADTEAFYRILRLIPDDGAKDPDMVRLIAFRLKIDGEEKTGRFIQEKLALAEECGFTGRLFDFVKDDRFSDACGES